MYCKIKVVNEKALIAFLYGDLLQDKEGTLILNDHLHLTGGGQLIHRPAKTQYNCSPFLYQICYEFSAAEYEKMKAHFIRIPFTSEEELDNYVL